MQLSRAQKGNIEVGWAMVYVGKHCVERYIEDVLNIYGTPSRGKYDGCVYVWNGEDLDPVHEAMNYEPFKSLEEAEDYVDTLKA